MSHAVHFRSADGSTTFEPAESLDAALARVEQLRNEEGVSEVRVYREVPVTFRTYYKATVAEEPSPSPSPPPAPAAAEAEQVPPPAAATPPPGAMPLTPPAPPATDSDEAVDERPGRGSLFSRG